MKEVAEQIAALPIKWDKKGKMKVLIITSRGTGRWIMPKGWTMDGKKPWRAAEIEALEEAGAVGHISSEQIGEYHYKKVMSSGKKLRCRVRVYPMIVEKLKRNWKERNERKRKWVSAKTAAKRVWEPELAELLRSLSKKPHRQPIIQDLLKAS
ncbi:NUDIX hydrolase [Oceanibium sediminis]|uniref:NUDIX hydrolase n=1 Tax=Oceanibium sediminis TaxID=2026339 RepID=UPI000DD4CC5D|nr:NUDIX domain-containing protein [Oceanibium sediminis]